MFRYFEKKYNLSLLQLGCVRIGTLHDFRNSEQHKGGIADPQEGKKRVTHHIENLHLNGSHDAEVRKSKDARALSEFNIFDGVENQNIVIENVLMQRTFDHPECFVFCTSKHRSKQTMRQFEDADSCVQIQDINIFYSILTTILNTITPVRFRGVHEVIYTNREEQWNGLNWGRHPALIKEEEFIQQGEIRAIWEPMNNHKIKPIILGNYRLCSTCTEISI